MRRHCLAAFLGLVAAHCGGSTRTNGSDLCQPGERMECDCIGHTKGIRVCSTEGVGFDECMCANTRMDGGRDIDEGGATPPASACSSKAVWTDGVLGSPFMTPGRPCIPCHSSADRTPFTVAGTVYGSLGDPDDCNGIDGTLGGAIGIMDEMGAEIVPRLQINRVGNFFSARILPRAYRVKIIVSGRESIMRAPVTNGDCNVCHTAKGAQGASGRITRSLP
jgi:hypothetical protein